MSNKIKPSFTVDGKTYELYYSKAMQVEYQKKVNEKKRDTEYQNTVAEYSRLQAEYEQIHERYENAKVAYLDNPLDKDGKALYLELKETDKMAFDEFNAYSSQHPEGDGRDFVINCLEQLVLYGLKEQYKLDEKQAEDVWCSYVSENGEVGGMLFLSCLGAAWLTADDEDSTNPFVAAQMARLEKENNRRIGLNKIKK